MHENKRKSFPFLTTIALGAVLLGSACANNTAPEALPSEQVPTVVENAFEEAPAEVKDSAQAIMKSIRAQDEVAAFLGLQALASRPDLTAEQRDAATRSMLTMNEKLRGAAAQGDQRAEAALQAYRSMK